MPTELEIAKAAAVERFLSPAEPLEIFTSLAVSTVPKHNVTGVGIGPKIRNGRDTGRQCVRIYVEKKIAPEALPSEHLLPSSIEGVETDVIETGRLVALAAAAAAIPARTRRRPADPGSSIGFQMPGGVMAGTFGALVKDAAGKLHILSNNHVLADENQLPKGSPIFQPGLLDGGNPLKDQIARLTAFVKIQAGVLNKVDCAIAEVLDPKSVTTTFMPTIGKLASTAVPVATVNMQVEKVGRTTGHTAGVIVDVNATMKIQYDVGTVAFDNQIIIEGDGGASFSAAGDSGSLIVERTSKQAVGLLFAGSASHTIANHLTDVLAALSVSLG